MFKRDISSFTTQERAQFEAEVEKGQQLAGHFPDEDAMGRLRRILNGSLTVDDAFDEIDRKYAALGYGR